MLDLAITAIAAYVLQKLATDVSQKVYDKAVDGLSGAVVESLVRDQAKQLDLLRTIDSKVDALLQGDYNAAMLFLRDAAKAHRTPDERRVMLDKARDRFFDALGKEAAVPARAALIRLNLGLAEAARDDWPSAEEQLEEATLDAILAGPALMRPAPAAWLLGGEPRNDAGPLVELLASIRQARIALGALAPSVPRIQKTVHSPFSLSFPDLAVPHAGSDPNDLADPSSHWLEPLDKVAEDEIEARSPLGARTGAFGRANEVRRRVWITLLLEPTPALERIAAAASGGPDPGEQRVATALATSVATHVMREGGDSSHGTTARRVCADRMVADRRANWPPRALAALRPQRRLSARDALESP